MFFQGGADIGGIYVTFLNPNGPAALDGRLEVGMSFLQFLANYSQSFVSLIWNWYICKKIQDSFS